MSWRATLAQVATAVVVSFVVLWATYLFDVDGIGNQTVFDDQPEWQAIPAFVKETPVPMPSLPLGLLRLLAHNRWGHPAYLNGEITRRGWWYYFPEAVTLKSPLALIVGIAIAIGAIVWLRGRGRLARVGQVAAVAGVFLLIAMAGNVNIGIRHVLPIIPMLYLLVCAALLRARLAALVLVLIAVAAVETAWIHPDYLAFFNLIAGGPARGERFLVDSNLDWGQDLGRLARWLKSAEAPDRPCALHLFTFAPEEHVEHLGLDPELLGAPPPSRGLLAISKNIRHGVIGTELGPDGDVHPTVDYSWLEKYPVVKRIGHSIEVYDLSASPDVATAHANTVEGR